MIDADTRLPPGEYPSTAMILDATCHISFTATAPIPAIMMLRPCSGYTPWITREEYAFQPHAPVVEFTDGFTNLCQRVLIPRGCKEFTSAPAASETVRTRTGVGE